MSVKKLPECIQSTLSFIQQSQNTLNQLKQYQNKRTSNFFGDNESPHIQQALATLNELSNAILLLQEKQNVDSLYR